MAHEALEKGAEVSLTRGAVHTPAPPYCASHADISLLGDVNAEMARQLIDGLRNPPASSTITIELSTVGGDAEIARRMVLEIDEARARLASQRLIFLGKSTVYSAGVTIMSAFPRDDRFLSSDAILLIHSRQLEKDIKLSGPIGESLPKLQAISHEIETGMQLEQEGFERLIAGSLVSLAEVQKRAPGNWYLRSQEALDKRLVGGIF